MGLRMRAASVNLYDGLQRKMIFEFALSSPGPSTQSVKLFKTTDEWDSNEPSDRA